MIEPGTEPAEHTKKMIAQAYAMIMAEILQDGSFSALSGFEIEYKRFCFDPPPRFVLTVRIQLADEAVSDFLDDDKIRVFTLYRSFGEDAWHRNDQ